MNILLFDTGDVRNEYNEPLGIELLAACLERTLGSVVKIDMKWYSKDGLDFSIDRYDVIGVGIHIEGISVFEALYKMYESAGSSACFVVGNTVSTFGYSQLLTQYPDILCAIGEGEIMFTKLVEGLLTTNNIDLRRIPNMAYSEKGNIVVTNRTVCNLNEYVPPIRKFNTFIKEKTGIARIEASRGCSWNKCSFCGVAHKYPNSKWRPIPVNEIIAQLIDLSDNGLTSVYFSDEDFIGDDTERFRFLVEQIKQNVIAGKISENIKYFISVKPTDVADDERFNTIEMFTQYGLKELFIGIESGCTNQIQRYNKCTKVDTNSRVIKKLQSLNVAIDLGFIFFDYDMTLQDIQDNLCFISKNELQGHSSLLKPLRLQPFTKIFYDIPAEILKDFSLEQMMYAYKFKDKTVEEIFNCFSSLGLERYAHKVQSFFRKSLSSIDEREESRKQLVKIRVLQFEALSIIVEHYSGDSRDNHILEEQLAYIKSKIIKLGNLYG
ncbi:MAG: radical SAM protein [Defluviitaleaceae bacterium]|nr:radical SAM protein [Defluviitaleaceae bacterium]